MMKKKDGSMGEIPPVIPHVDQVMFECFDDVECLLE